MLDFLKLQMLSPLCVRCGSFQVQECFLCKNCEESFLNGRLKPQWRDLNNHFVQSLIEWHPGESDSLSEIVYLLKSRLSQKAWAFYSRQVKITCSHNAVIVPVPSSRTGRTAFHTKYFAEALRAQHQVSIIDCLLSFEQKGSQEALTVEKRAEIQFQFIEDFTQKMRSYHRVILIDDIITTGHTLSACLSVLKEHMRPSQEIEIIALFSRFKV